VAEHIDGIAQSSILEAVAGIPVTAHILGGAPIGPDAGKGVVDGRSRVFGYDNLLVCDGAAVPANPGVNPSLTITALAEHAMSHVPPGPRAGSVPSVRMTAEIPEREPQPAISSAATAARPATLRAAADTLGPYPRPGACKRSQGARGRREGRLR